tara:strand:- start:23 stop:367 length:345 start_codon:yes stop_codon:yes gene_type:complete
MTRTPFKLRSGNSPVKQGGIILKGLKYVGKKLLSKKGVTTGLAAGAAEQAVSDNTKNRSTVEKVVRAVDEWGPTMGIGSYIYDNKEDIVKESKKAQKSKAKRSTKGFVVGERKT